MTPLDLTKTKPRAAACPDLGIVFLARTIDKARAVLPGGNLGSYRISASEVDTLSAMLLARLGLGEAAFVQLVGRASSDADILAWIHDRIEPSVFDEWNRWASSLRICDCSEAGRASLYATNPSTRFMPEDTQVLDALDREDSIDGSHDFDFLFGSWNVRNRRLRKPLTGSNVWYEFDATSIESPVLGGLGNLEQYDAPDVPNGPIHAVAMRLYDRTAQEWSIYWSTAGSGSFVVPTLGRFHDGVGLFYSREEYEGRPIIVRFTWTHGDAGHCRWEQAFSDDDGKSWESNWIMEFTRARGAD